MFKKQFESGKVNEEQYRAFQREIAATEGQLKKLEIATESNNAALNKTADNFNDAEKQAEQLSDELKKSGDSFDKAGSKALSFGDVLKANLISEAVVGGIKALGSAVGSMVNKFTDLVSSAMDSADELTTLSSQTGLTTEQLQIMKFQGDDLGVSLDTMTGSMSKLINNMSGASEGSGAAFEAFNKLGISVVDNEGKLRNSTDVYSEVLNALGSVANETERTAIAQDIFGKSASELLPLIQAGSTGLADLAAQALASGAVMSGESIVALDTFGDSIDHMKQSLIGIVADAIEPLMPKIQELISYIQKNTPGIKDILTDITETIINGMGWLVDNGDTIIGVLGGIATGFIAWNVVALIQGIVTAIQAFKLANEGATIAQIALNLAMSLNPIGIIVALIAGLVAAFVILWNTNEDFRNKVIEIWNGIKKFFSDTINAIKNFFVETIPEVIKNVITWFSELPTKLKDIGKKFNRRFMEWY